MPIPATVEETNRSRKTDWQRGTREYIVRGCTSESAAMLSLLSNVPAISPLGMPLAVSECTVEEVANDIYLGTAVYTPVGIAALQTAGSFSVSFDISGQGAHLYVAYKHLNDYPAPGETAKNFKGAINVDHRTHDVGGTDVVIPTTTFTVNYTTAPANVTEAYVAAVAKLVGGVNDAPFKGFAAGELLLSRVGGQQRDGQNWDLAFGFAVSENRTDFTFAGIPHISKRGWDFLWVYCKTDDSTGAMLEVPIQASVEQVYLDKDFSALGLP